MDKVIHHYSKENRSPQKANSIIDCEKILDKINILTTKYESNCTKLPTIKDFCIIKPISRGAFGKVFLGYKNNDPDKLFAIKVMRKSEMINKNMISQVINERNALALSRSPFCVSLFYSLQSTSYIYLVMDYMVGGDLKSLLAMSGFFDENTARFYAAEVTLALQYLHEHGIVHRDIKPDNMLLSATGHVKLTDFGLSKIELRRDLEISDLINCSPNLNSRTPGQLLSLTSHLSFGSEKKIDCGVGPSKFNKTVHNALNVSESSDSEADTSCNESEKIDESKISGVSPFFSVEEINISVTQICSNTYNNSSSYHTCTSEESSPSFLLVGTQKLALLENNNVDKINSNTCNGCKADQAKPTNAIESQEKLDESFGFSVRMRLSKGQEDSGVSSRQTDCSNEGSLLGKTEHFIKDDFSSSDFSRSHNENSKIRTLSPFRNVPRNFKRPDYFRSMKRKINLANNSENSSYEIDVSSCSTGLTQEIDILDIGSSTPKRRKGKSPIRGVLKIRSLSDDEMLVSENIANVAFSTPVSSQKAFRRETGLLGKLKSTRFNLPHSLEAKRIGKLNVEKATVQYMKIAEDLAMSPINLRNNTHQTPNKINTPFRTPKSVRRGVRPSEERILGTPDYLAPELLLIQGHGPAVDWWALGVCLYEFLTGIPPFNDETPQKVFDNILNMNIEWPQEDEALSAEAVDAVKKLLTVDPLKRPAAKEVQSMQFFVSINWSNLENETPPFIPTPENPTDTGYFDARNNMQHIKLSNFAVED